MKQCEIESAIIEYFGLQEIDVTNKTEILANFGELVDFLAFYQQKYDEKNWLKII